MIRSKRGGILIYMLGMIALLSVVVTQFLLETATEIRYRSQVTHRDDLRILAHSVLETTIAVLAEVKEVDKGLYSPQQDWGKPLEYANFVIPKNYTVSVTIRDETGKLSIYDENMKTFEDLMAEMHISYEEVTNLKSELKEWLGKPNELFKAPEEKSDDKPKKKEEEKKPEQTPRPAANPTTDEQAQPTRPPEDKDKDKDKKKKQRQIYNLLQLKELPAFEKVFFDSKKNPNEKFKLLKNSVSILHKGPFNLNTAPKALRKMVLGDLRLAPTGQEEPYYRSMKQMGIEGNAGKELEKVISFNARVLDINIQVARGAVKYYLSAIVDFGEEPKKEESQPSQGEGQSVNPESQARAGEDQSNANENPPSDIKNKPKDTKDKEEFTFLALTEDDSFDN